MNRRWLFATPFVAALLLAAQPNPGAGGPGEAARVVPQNSFGRGETIRYRVHYGFINAAEATIETSGRLERINERPCYQATVTGRTTGSFDYFLRIRDQWRSYIDTASILPMRATRDIAEKNYRKKETVNFDHLRDLAEVHEQKKDREKRTTVKILNNAQDMVSGFYFLRTLNYERLKPGDVLKVPGFLEGDSYVLEVTFRGREITETKAGAIRTIKLTPKMPANKLFRGENAISVYLSDDKNKIPVLFQAELFVGSIKVDMYKAEGLKSRLNMAR